MVWQLRHAVAEYPDSILMGTDCRNAFGCAHRAPAVAHAERAVPTFGRLLRNLWDGVDTPIHVNVGSGEYDCISAKDGFVQGGCEAAPGFALCLAVAMQRFIARAETLAPGPVFKCWAYMDDVYYRCEA